MKPLIFPPLFRSFLICGQRNLLALAGSQVAGNSGLDVNRLHIRTLLPLIERRVKTSGEREKSATRASSISPGFVDTPILDQYFKGRENQLAQTRAEQNMLSPQDIAATAVHILNAPEGVEINDISIRSSDQVV